MIELVVGVFLFILPIANHIGIFIAIRRHNKHVAGAVSGQDSSGALVRREKKVAIDMVIVIAVLLFCLVPIVVFNMFKHFLVDEYG